MMTFILLTVPLAIFAFYLYNILQELEKDFRAVKDLEAQRDRDQLERFIKKLADDVRR